MYHSHGHSLLRLIKAFLSLEMPEIEAAQESMAQTLALCDTIRPQNYRDNFIVKLFIKPNYDEFTDGKHLKDSNFKNFLHNFFLRGNTRRTDSH